MWQTVFDAISCEVVTVESTQSVRGAEPEKAVRVTHNALNEVAWQPVGSRVGPDR